jgi:H+/Cl- antiporter ClcA
LSKISLRRSIAEHIFPLRELVRWIPIAAVVGVLAGSASALLLVSLNYATGLRESHVWLILLLAPAGWLMGQMYKRFGASVVGGNNLILEQVHAETQEQSATIPLRMTPLILIGTFMTHLFGGSAGREGTAIQTGASLADQLARPFRMDARERRILLMAGISAGFGSVFGTPLAGAIFGLEVLALGTVTYEAIAPCLMAAFVGDLVTRAWSTHLTAAWGFHHTIYPVGDVPQMTVSGFGYSMLAGIVFGLAAMGFAKLTHGISHWSRRHIANSSFRPVVGGLLVTVAVFGIGTSHTLKYLGLGIPTILESFTGRVAPYDFAAKTLFTSATLGFGFKGGEVTPLFYIGATLGNALSRLIPLPAALLAAMGFAAVFGGAANTPIASTLLAVELFGAETGAYAGIACVIAYLFSGHNGIYTAQRVGRTKHLDHVAEEGMTLDGVAKMREGRGELEER